MENTGINAAGQCAMEWWNTLSSAGRTRMCDIHTELSLILEKQLTK